MKDYPKREIELFKNIGWKNRNDRNSTGKYQELTFQKLFGYYSSRYILNQRTFIKNLGQNRRRRDL